MTKDGVATYKLGHQLAAALKQGTRKQQQLFVNHVKAKKEGR